MCNIAVVQAGKRTIRVADIKSKYIANIIDAAKKSSGIDKIVLFGSSLGRNCKESSDMDLAIFGSQTRNKYFVTKEFKSFYDQLIMFDDFKQAYDILYFQTGSRNDDLILQEIMQGEVLYER